MKKNEKNVQIRAYYQGFRSYWWFPRKLGPYRVHCSLVVPPKCSKMAKNGQKWPFELFQVITAFLHAWNSYSQNILPFITTMGYYQTELASGWGITTHKMTKNEPKLM